MTHSKVGLVTGSSKGIGAAISRRLARDGYYVYITYHSDQAAADAVLDSVISHGGCGEVMHLDVRKEPSVRTAFARVDEHFGHLDVLVNNAVTEIAKDLESVNLD